MVILRLEYGKDLFGLKLDNVVPTFLSYEYMKIIYVNCGVKNYVKIIAVIYATFAVAKRKLEKQKFRLVRDSNP